MSVKIDYEHMDWEDLAQTIEDCLKELQDRGTEIYQPMVLVDAKGNTEPLSDVLETWRARKK